MVYIPVRTISPNPQLRRSEMPIDRDKALAATFEPGEGSYNQDNVILYHLGIGAGDPPTDTNEL